MKENESALYSRYIIDGIRCDSTPADLLDECMEECVIPDDLPDFNDIIDESTEPPISSFTYESDAYREYISEIRTCSSGHEREFRMLYADHFTRLQIAKALLLRLWSQGHFRLCDLRVWAQWDWNTRPIGNMAAFYTSAQSSSEYLYGLGVSLADYLFIESDEGSNVKFFAWLPEVPDALFKSSPYESSHPWITDTRKCPGTLQNDSNSWLIYIPFDTCAYRLGGSLLAQAYGHNGGTAPNISDPDYFIDCYEVVRELVEDGIVMSGCTVADGGLATAAAIMCGDGGIELDIKGIMSSYQDCDKTRILFGETPGVIIQISDENYDYVDSQFLLQDIAYYPIGHPSDKEDGVSLSDVARQGVGDILASLLNQASEGED